MNLLWGSWRSSKSIAVDLKWIRDVVTLPEGNMLMVGNTINSLIRNVLTPMMSMVGKNNIDIRVQRKEVDIFGRTIWLEGADKMDAYKRIEGESLLRAYVDEWTQVPVKFTKTMMSRLSDPGACVYGTCNPGGPGHYLYRDYIKRSNEIDIALWHFTLDDNPWLDPAYKAAIIAENPIGTVFYDRNIRGKWVAASGIVFANFNRRYHVGVPPSNLLPKELRIGIDYGTHNPTSFVSIEKYLVPGKLKPTWYVTDEYYWDSTVMCQQKTDGEYSKDLADYMSGRWVQPPRLQALLGGEGWPEVGSDGSKRSVLIEYRNGNDNGNVNESRNKLTEVELINELQCDSQTQIKNTPPSSPVRTVGCQADSYSTGAPRAPVEYESARRAAYASTIEVDPSAASFILQLNKDGMRKARAADNDVLNGIRKIATMISKGELVFTRRCPWLIKTMQTYSWNPDKMQDEVIKEDDHSIDALRYVINSL